MFLEAFICLFVFMETKKSNADLRQRKGRSGPIFNVFLKTLEFTSLQWKSALYECFLDSTIH